MTDPACGLCNRVVTLEGCPVHHPLQWEVETISAFYRIDMRDGLIVRTRKAIPAHADWPEASLLRLDGDCMSLLAIFLCQPGVGMEVLIQLRDDGVQTIRQTTPVVAIRPVPMIALPPPTYAPYRASTPNTTHP